VKRGKGDVWSNEYFIRNEPTKVKRMQRVRIKGDTKKQSSAADLATAVGFVNPFLMPTTSPSMVQSSDGQLTSAADAINNGLTNYTFVAPPLVPGTTIPIDQSTPLLLPPKKKQKTTTKSKSTKKKKKSAGKGSKKKDKSLTPNEVPSSPSKMVIKVPTLPPIYDNSMKTQKESTTAEQEAEEDDAMIDTIVRSAISNNMSLLPPSMATEVLPLANNESSTASMSKPTVQEGSADNGKATILLSQIPPQPTKRKQRPKCSTPGCISFAVYDNLCLKHGTTKANGVQTEAPVKSTAEKALEAATAKLIEEQKRQQQAEQTATTQETTKKKASKKKDDGGKNNSEEMDVAHVLFGLASSKASSPVESEESE